MGLLQQIEDDKAKLAEMIEGGIVENEDEIIEEEKEPEAEEAEEPVEKDVATEEEKEPEEEKPLDGKDYARMRRERREARKAEIEAQEAEKVRFSQPQQEIAQEKEVIADPEPDRATQYPQWLEWNNRKTNEKAERAIKKLEEIEAREQQERLIQSAIEDFTAIENNFKKIEPSYEQAADFYLNQLSRSIQLLYPQASKQEIAETIRIQVLNKAAMYHSKGLDPAEELFEEAISLGFNPEVAEQNPVKKEVKPNLDKIASNRERNAGMSASGGVVKKLNLSTAANMTTGEWNKLSKAEKDAILKGGR